MQTLALANNRIKNDLLTLPPIRLDAIPCGCNEVYIHFPRSADFQPRGLLARQYGVFREGQG